MIFNSATFFVFFIIFFLLYWLINNNLTIKFRNLFIIFSSYLFYGWWDWKFLSLIIISSFTDFIIGLQLNKSTKLRNRRLLLISSLTINLSILGFFKYFNFFAESLSDLMNLFSVTLNSNTLKIILPVGISFYTFQTLSYTIDIYKKKIAPTKDVIFFFAFVSFFPQLVAGPIERASHLLNQFHDKKTFNYNINIEGLRLILWGFFKKIVIADNFGVLADNIFNIDTNLSGLTLLFGAIFFAFQIYADFSGYSDIAIGISKMLGFDLMQNFKTPYFSKSFSDFWRRWHISLSTWFRDYVYIPLGGNKGKKIQVQLNILITFLLSGLWHGAGTTFLIWGGLHGLLLIIEKQINFKLNKLFYSPFVLICVILLWIPFRSENLSNLIEYSSSLLTFSSYSFNQLKQIIFDFSAIRFLVLGILSVFFLFIEYFINSKDFNTWIKEKPRIIRITLYYALVFAIVFIGNFTVKPNFIYFQF
ncbi:MAG TPA: membrane-bound O-acyltransferase family protein [Bacteroidales bacterium]|nr:membrane-bound O-acyltransferase family protein [Bacteroidales bacterium]